MTSCHHSVLPLTLWSNMNSAPSPLGQINSGQELYTSAQTGQLQPEKWNMNCIEGTSLHLTLTWLNVWFWSNVKRELCHSWSSNVLRNSLKIILLSKHFTWVLVLVWPDCLRHFPLHWPRARCGHQTPRGGGRGLVDIVKVILKICHQKALKLVQS